MSAPFDAGGRALFEDTMAGRFESAAQRPNWNDVDEDERAGWRATAAKVVAANRTDIGTVVPATNQAGEVEAWLYQREGCASVVAKNAHRWANADGWVETPLVAVLATQPATSQEGNCPKIPDSSIAATPQQSEEGTALGEVQCACSEDDGVPDVGVSVGLGNGKALWIGETLLRDGSNLGVVFHGPDQQRIVAPLPDETDWQAIGDIIRHHVAPALAAAPTPLSQFEDLREALRKEADDWRHNSYSRVVFAAFATVPA